MELNDKIKEAIATFVENKPLNRVYPVTYYDETSGCDYTTYVDLTDGEVETIRKIIEEYGLENFYDHLPEDLFGQDTDISDILPPDVTDINLDTVINAYQFTMHLLQKDGTMLQRKLKLKITPSDYKSLLEVYVPDPGMNFNKLRYADQKKYDWLQRNIDYNNCDEDYYVYDEPYLITMDELEADAAEIRKQFPNLQKTVGFIGYFCP